MGVLFHSFFILSFFILFHFLFSFSPFSFSVPGLHIYDAQTLEWLDIIDTYPFPWAGNQAMRQGRLSLSGNGRWLAVNVSEGVRVYDLHSGGKTNFRDVLAAQNCTSRSAFDDANGLLMKSPGSAADFTEDGIRK